MASDCYFALGKNNLRIHETGSFNSSISQFLSHPNWSIDDERREADIAIAVLKAPVEISRFVNTLCLYNRNSHDLYGKFGTISGWGSTQQDSKKKSDVALESDVKFGRSDHCLLDYPELSQFFGKTSLCVVSDNGTGACSGKFESVELGSNPHISLNVLGDSGGSLVIKENNKYYATGIISASLLTSDFKCDIGRPQIYTDISAYYDWIVGIVEST